MLTDLGINFAPAPLRDDAVSCSTNWRMSSPAQGIFRPCFDAMPRSCDRKRHQIASDVFQFGPQANSHCKKVIPEDCAPLILMRSANRPPLPPQTAWPRQPARNWRIQTPEIIPNSPVATTARPRNNSSSAVCNGFLFVMDLGVSIATNPKAGRQVGGTLAVLSRSGKGGMSNRVPS
jgi:hypothetical protein